MSTRQNILFYFPGTGNSLYAAKRLAEKLSGTELIPMAKHVETGYQLKKVNIVGFVFPTYAWGPPKIVEKFMGKLSITDFNYSFILATYAGRLGGCVQMTNKILNKSGINCNAGFGLIMPSNNLIIDNPPDGEVKDKILNIAAKRIDKLAEQISKKSGSIPSTNLFNSLLSTVVHPLFLYGVPIMVKRYNVNENCNGCGICEKICPMKNITLDNKRKPVWSNRCVQCVACLNLVP